MIDRTELHIYDQIKEVTDQGQWAEKRSCGWMPQTQHTSTVFMKEGLSVTICWQKKQNSNVSPSIVYFKIDLKGKELMHPLSFMLEAEECFRLFYLLSDIQSKGIDVVDTESRKQHYSCYIRKDTKLLLRTIMESPESKDAVLEKFETFSQQEKQFVESCKAEYMAQVHPVRLFAASGYERLETGIIKKHYLIINHTPMQQPRVPRLQPFRIQVQESRNGENKKMKSAHLDLTNEQFSSFVTAMWEAYKQWWYAK